MTYVELNEGNIEPYYYDWDGSVYYEAAKIGAKDGKYWPASRYDLEDLRTMLGKGVKLLYVEGDAIPPFRLSELKN